MHGRQVGSPILLVFVLVSLSVLVGASPASAACDDEETLFVRKTITGLPANWAYGTANNVLVGNRDLSTTCLRETEAHSAAHMRNTAGVKYAEIGWYQDWDCGLVCSPSDDKRWQLFCGYSYGTNSGYEYHGIAPAQGSGYLVRMMVQYREGTDHFHFLWDVGANGNFVEVCDDKYVQFNHGYPMGETGRRGGVGTGASDHHWLLKYHPCPQCTQVAWGGNTTASPGGDNISNWHYDQCSATEYWVFKDGSGNTC